MNTILEQFYDKINGAFPFYLASAQIPRASFQTRPSRFFHNHTSLLSKLGMALSKAIPNFEVK